MLRCFFFITVQKLFIYKSKWKILFLLPWVLPVLPLDPSDRFRKFTTENSILFKFGQNFKFS